MPMHPHITIKPIGGPFGGPFGLPFPPFGAPTGPMIHHASLSDLFKNISKPGPHPKFESVKIIDLNDAKKDSTPPKDDKETKKEEEKKPEP